MLGLKKVRWPILKGNIINWFKWAQILREHFGYKEGLLLGKGGLKKKGGKLGREFSGERKIGQQGYSFKVAKLGMAFQGWAKKKGGFNICCFAFKKKVGGQNWEGGTKFLKVGRGKFWALLKRGKNIFVYHIGEEFQERESFGKGVFGTRVYCGFMEGAQEQKIFFMGAYKDRFYRKSGRSLI